MLEPAERAILKQEREFPVRCSPEQCDRLATEAFECRNKRSSVERGGVGERPVHDAVRRRIDRVPPTAKPSGKYRRIDENLCTRREEREWVGGGNEARRDLPASRRLDPDVRGRKRSAHDVHEGVRAAGESARG